MILHCERGDAGGGRPIGGGNRSTGGAFRPQRRESHHRGATRSTLARCAAPGRAASCRRARVGRDCVTMANTAAMGYVSRHGGARVLSRMLWGPPAQHIRAHQSRGITAQVVKHRGGAATPPWVSHPSSTAVKCIHLVDQSSKFISSAATRRRTFLTGAWPCSAAGF